MLGATVNGSTQRIVSDVYTDNIVSFKFGIDPLKNKTLRAVTEYRTRSMHLGNIVYCNILDIKVADRLTNEDDSKTYVVLAVPEHKRGLGNHMELVVRQIASDLHETVNRKILSVTQTYYDPILLEYSGAKSWEESDLSVLLDPIEQAKEHFIQIVEGGKLDKVDYIMTVDLPTSIDVGEKFDYKDIEYDVMWVIPQPFQTLVGIKKSVTNYF